MPATEVRAFRDASGRVPTLEWLNALERRDSMATTKNLAESIRRKLASNPDLAAAVDAERFRINVGVEIFAARTSAHLTQKQLAERAGMRQSAIARIEDADYDGHSLKTLERIAFALGKRLEVRFVSSTAEGSSDPPEARKSSA